MVNTHRKFPIDAKHNAYYAADGSDLRDATKEEIEKYQLAALHKRRKPDADPAWGKGGSSASTARGDKRARERPHQRDEKQRGSDSSRDRKKDRESHNRKAEVKDKWAFSRDARRVKDTFSTELCKSDSKKDAGVREKDRSSTERRRTDGKKDAGVKKKDVSLTERGRTDVKKGAGNREKDDRAYEQKRRKRSEYTGLDEVDEDERGRPNVADIQRCMEVRKAARELNLLMTQAEASKPSRASHATSVIVPLPTIGSDKSVEVKTTVTRRAPVKTGRTPDELMSADVRQREAARQWAEEETSTTSTVPQSTGEKGSTRLRAVAKKASDRQHTASKEDKGNLDAQEYIASQYPPVDEGVSSTVRLGRSLVSGAMGRRTDDPKMFETVVELMDCSVALRTTKDIAKTPVSNPPPNSIDSDVEEDEVSDARLSQSTTDTGVHIELPEGNAKIKDQGVRTVAGITTEKPKAPGCVATPVLLSLKSVNDPKTRMEEGTTVLDKEERLEVRTNVTPRSVFLSEYSRMIDEIDASALMQAELRRTDPTLASASSFLSVVTGGIKRKRIVEESEDVPVTEAETKVVSTKMAVVQPPSAKYLEKQRTTGIVLRSLCSEMS